MRLIGRSGKLLLIMIALSTSVYGQQYKSPVAGGGPFSDVVLRAPFSATATTRVREVLQDGTVREDLVKAASPFPLVRPASGPRLRPWARPRWNDSQPLTRERPPTLAS